MNKKLRKSLTYLIPVIVVVVFVLIVWLSLPQSDVTVFELSNPGWGDLRLRKLSDSSDVLLITRKDPNSYAGHYRVGDVYQYDPENNTLKIVPFNIWKDASGKITRFDTPIETKEKMELYYNNYKLLSFGDNTTHGVIPTMGKYVLRVRGNLSGKTYAAVTSDVKPTKKNRAWWFSWGGGYRGQHYVELFSVPDMKPRGVIRIPFNTEDGIESPCWSADGRFIVYSTLEQNEICIIDTKKWNGE